MYVPVLHLLIVLFAIALIALIIWIAYAYSAAYQNTLSITIPVEDTFYFINGVVYPITSLTFTVSGKVKDKKTAQIMDAHSLQNDVMKKIVEPHGKGLFVHESQIFTVPEENKLTRHPLAKLPTLENLSIIFFKKIEHVVNSMRQGGQLVSVELDSHNMKVSRSRYKINSYTL